jgi:hypothetical protein
MQASSQIDWRKDLLLVWVVLLPLWIPLAMVSLMPAADSGTIDAYVFAGSILTYPLVVLIVAIFRRRVKWIVFAPCINIVATLFAYYTH